MICATDFAILQRDKNGFGYCLFDGEIENTENSIVVVRVMSENNNMTVVPWTEAVINDNKWNIELKIPQGGLYRLEARVADGEFNANNNRYDWADLIKCVYHLGVGDIFVMGGQSNMSGYGKDFAFDPPTLGVHLFNNEGRWGIAAHPLNSVAESIYPNNDSNSGVSPGLSFARTLYKELGVPIGLISCACGGTAFEDWDPFDEEENYLYKSMVKKCEDAGGVAGMIWAQGCTDAENEENTVTYFDRFNRAIKVYREKLGNIPIAICQINRHAFNKENRDRRWGIIREAQRQIALINENVYIVPTTDLPMSDGIHNSAGGCVILGERIANVMLHGWYGKYGRYAPSLKYATKIDNDKVLLEFYGDYVFVVPDGRADGIEIEDENGTSECICAENNEKGLIVQTDRFIGKNAVINIYYKTELPCFIIKDAFGMPLLSCYNVKIKY